MNIPRDEILVAAFEKGRERGRHRAKHYRNQCPYSPTRQPMLCEAWLTGYDFGFEEGSQ